MAAPALNYWYAALAAPHGVRLRTNDPARLRTALYNARTACSDPSLAAVSVRTPHINADRELWLVVDRAKLNASQGNA